MPTSVTPVGSVTGSSKANCDFKLTVKTARVSKANLVTSFLQRQNKQKTSKIQPEYIFITEVMNSQQLKEIKY